MVSNVVSITLSVLITTVLVMTILLPSYASDVDEFKRLEYSAFQHTQAGRFSQALLDYQKASTLRKDDAEIWYHLAVTHNLLGQHQQAQENIDRAISLAPNKIDYLLTRAELSLSGGDSQSSMKDLKEILARRPDSRKALFFLASNHTFLGQTAAAAAIYSRIVKQSDRDYIYYRSAGMLYLGERQFRKASDTLLEGQRRCKEDPVLRHLRAQALTGLGDSRGVIREVNSLEKNHLDISASISLRGGAYLMIGEYDRASADLKRALTLNPHDTSTLCLLLTCSAKTRDLPTMHDALRRLGIESALIKDDQVLMNIAKTEQEAGCANEALKTVTRAMRLRKERGTLKNSSLSDLVAAASLCAKFKQTSESIEYYQLVVSASGDDPKYLLELGRLYYEQKRWPEAEKCLNRALAKVDTMHRSKVLNMLAIVYRSQNKTAEAVKVEREAHRLTKTIYERHP